jgi:hypothetical protein
VTGDEWVEAALAARAEQGLPDGIEDDATLAVLAELLSKPSTRHGHAREARDARGAA